MLKATYFMMAALITQAAFGLPLLDQRQAILDSKPRDFGCRFELPSSDYGPNNLFVDYSKKTKILTLQKAYASDPFGRPAVKSNVQFKALTDFYQAEKDGNSVIQFEKKALGGGVNHHAAYKSPTYGILKGLCYFND